MSTPPTENNINKLFYDVWEDWIVYGDYDPERSPDTRSTCGYNNQAAAEIILRYLPTGEEWNLSKKAGEQLDARMWGPLVVWADYPWKEYDDGSSYISPIQDVNGIDLCMHPELKDRFPECAGRK